MERVGRGSGFPRSRSARSTPHPLEPDELTILTAWAEAMAEMLAYAPGRAAALLAEARSGAAWRADLGLPEPSPQLGEAIDSMSREVLAAAPQDGLPTFDEVLSAANEDRSAEPQLDSVVRQVLRAMLEERRTRQPASGTSAVRAD